MLDERDKPSDYPRENPEPPQYPSDRIEKGDTSIPRK